MSLYETRWLGVNRCHAGKQQGQAGGNQILWE